MPIKLLAPNKYTPFYRGRGSYLGQYINRSTKARKRAIAVQVVAKWEREIERGEFSQPGELTFAGAALAYMKAGGERKYLRKLLEHFGDKPVSQITQAAIEDAAVILYPDREAATRNRSVFTPVSAILRHNGRRDLGLRRPKGSGGKSATSWLWPEQAESIFAEAEKLNPEFRSLLVVLCYTGLRLSEALNLTWENVRLQDGYAYIPDTKNDEPRAVFLPAVAVAALASVDRQEGGRCFRLAKSGHIYSLLKAAAFKGSVALPQRSAFHIFRHTYATWMRRYAGADSQALISTGAWKDRKSVDRYTHTIVSEEARRAELLPVQKLPKRTRGTEKTNEIN
jgi:integrase